VVIPLSGRVPERASGPSRSHVDDGGGLQYVSGKLIGSLGFSRRGEYIGGRAMSGSGPGAHTRPRRGQGVARAMGGVAALCPPSVSALESVLYQENRNFGFYFVQF
jgi:hypothetical protein